MEAGNSSLSAAVCRVCLCGEASIPYMSKNSCEPLISPCHCKGTMGLYHKSCLEHWLSTSKTTFCEICRFQYEHGIKKQNLTAYFRQRGWRERGFRSLVSDFAVLFLVFPIVSFLVYYCIRTAVRVHYRAEEERTSSPEGIAMLVMAFFILIGFLIWLTLSIVYHFAQFRVWQSRHKLFIIIDQLEQEPMQHFNSTTYNQTDGMGRPLLRGKLHWVKGLLCCGRGNSAANLSLLSMRDTVVEFHPEMIAPPVGPDGSPAYSSPSLENPNLSIRSASPASQQSYASSPESAASLSQSSRGGSPATISLSTFRPSAVTVHRPLCTSSPVESANSFAHTNSSICSEQQIYDSPPDANKFSDIDLGSPITDSDVSPSLNHYSHSP